VLSISRNTDFLAQISGSQGGQYRPPGVSWTIQGVDK